MGVSWFISRSLLAAGAVVATTLAPLAPHASATESAVDTEQAITSADQVNREPSTLNLRVTPGTRTEDSKTALLHCDPAGGTHPEASTACDQLSTAKGNFESLGAGKDRPMCPMVYEPVTVKATGTWKDTPVQYSKQYSNTCEMKAHTGAVFDF